MMTLAAVSLLTALVSGTMSTLENDATRRRRYLTAAWIFLSLALVSLVLS